MPYELKVWKSAGSRIYDSLQEALRDLPAATRITGDDSLGRVTDLQTGDVVNEFYLPYQKIKAG